MAALMGLTTDGCGIPFSMAEGTPAGPCITQILLILFSVPAAGRRAWTLQVLQGTAIFLGKHSAVWGRGPAWCCHIPAIIIITDVPPLVLRSGLGAAAVHAAVGQ